MSGAIALSGAVAPSHGLRGRDLGAMPLVGSRSEAPEAESNLRTK